MANQGKDIKHPKLRGEWAEMRFMARAAEHGLVVTKPWGDTSRYDFIVECDARCLRIQVKSTISKRENSYSCHLGGYSTLYTKDEFDFLAVYVIPLDLWYIIPSGVAITEKQKRPKLYISPEYAQSIYAPYREAWHLLKDKSAAPEPVAAGDASCDGPDLILSDDEEAEEASEVGQNPFAKIKWKPVWRPHWMPRR